MSDINEVVMNHSFEAIYSKKFCFEFLRNNTNTEYLSNKSLLISIERRSTPINKT